MSNVIVKADNIEYEIAIGDMVILKGGLADGNWLLLHYNDESIEAVFRDGERVMIINKKWFRVYE